MPQLLTRRTVKPLGVAGFSLERWPDANRNPGRLNLEICTLRQFQAAWLTATPASSISSRSTSSSCLRFSTSSPAKANSPPSRER